MVAEHVSLDEEQSTERRSESVAVIIGFKPFLAMMTL